MADSNMQLNWTDEQWNKVRQVVYEEARKARVAGNFLPLYGPLEPDARYISQESLKYGNPPPGLKGATIKVDDVETLQLSTLQVEVFLSGAQVADTQLTSALTAFRRAANIVARLEDEVIFNGQPGAGTVPPLTKMVGISRPTRTIGDVIGGQRTEGLLALRSNRLPSAKSRQVIRLNRKAKGLASNGEALVRAISKAIAGLEERHHLGPFACVLGHQYFNDVQTPQPNSMVLPQDRILPFLGGGALLRTSTLPENLGMVVALGGEPIDLVVGTDISVKFLQVTLDPCFVFRVYEKIVLRIKQPEAIALLYLTTTEGFIAEVDEVIAEVSKSGKKPKELAEAQKYRDAAEDLHKVDMHQEAVDYLAEVIKLLGID